MKKWTQAGVFFLMFLLIACGKNSEVDSQVQEAFSKRFPDAQKVTWGKENSEEWEAEFEQNQQEFSANFNTDGKWLETETAIEMEQLPQKISEAVKSDFSEAQIRKIFRIEQPNEFFYELELQQDNREIEVLYKESGELLKQKTVQQIEEYHQEGDD